VLNKFGSLGTWKPKKISLLKLYSAKFLKLNDIVNGIMIANIEPFLCFNKIKWYMSCKETILIEPIASCLR